MNSFVLTQLDAGVGRILSAIREAGAEDNSLVYFTSDHGGDEPQIGDQGGYNGVFRGGKGNGALEGGVRGPGIIKVTTRKLKQYYFSSSVHTSGPELSNQTAR